MALFFSGKEADIVFFKEEGSGHLVPRHREIVDELARKICKDLDIPFMR